MNFKVLVFVAIMNFNSFVSAQVENGYKGILPIRSNCQDVERILNISACNQPKVIFNTKFEEVSIFFTMKGCEKMLKRKLNYPLGTVSQVSIVYKDDYKEPISLDSLKINLDEFETSYSDIQTFFFSKEKGLEIVVYGRFPQGSNKIVYETNYYPPQNGVKLCPLDKNKPKPLFEGEIRRDLFKVIDQYWNLSLKEEKLRFKKLIPSLKLLLEEVKTPIDIVYFYNTEKDNKLGQKQAERAKKILENGGINPEIIQVNLGGKQDKSVIVIYVRW